ncbi:Uncharacterised protein [Mycobacteroides abscessus]|nr:Uncharacterised protein [Mycobacteroides abscessus]
MRTGASSPSATATDRASPTTNPPPVRGRTTAAWSPTWRRSTPPLGRSVRRSPASMSTYRRPPQPGHHTGPSAW